MLNATLPEPAATMQGAMPPSMATSQPPPKLPPNGVADTVAAPVEAKPAKPAKAKKVKPLKLQKVSVAGDVYEKLQKKAARLEEAEDLEKVASRLETAWLMKKAEASAAKKNWEEAVAKMRDRVRNGGDLLFPPTEAKAAGASESINKPAKNITNGPESLSGQDDSWKAVKLDSLEPKIAAAKLAALAEHDVTTIGELLSLQEKHGEWWAKRVKGFGAGGQEQLDRALDKYWDSHPRTTVVVDAAAAKRISDNCDRLLKPVSAASLGLTVDALEAALHADLLPRIQTGKVPEVRAHALEGFSHLYVTLPAPGGSEATYQLRPLLTPLAGAVPIAADDPYAGAAVKTGGGDFCIGPRDEAILVRADPIEAIPVARAMGKKPKKAKAKAGKKPAAKRRK